MEYSAVIPEAGTYDVYTYHHTSGGHCPQTFFDFNNGTTAVVRTEDVVGIGQSVSTWHKVASFEFEKDYEFSVSLRGDGGNGTVCADALMLVKQK